MNPAVQTTETDTPATVAAVVVLYNSPRACADNLRTYRSQVKKLYIIDNSPTPAGWVADEFGNDPAIVYQHFPQNVGIATALNTAARQAVRDGFAYLLTMDDDSRAPAGLVQTMLHYLATVPANPVGLVSPKHILTTASQQPTPRIEAPTPVLTTMTSGNLLNLRVYETIGPFRDDLFIDVVDHEYNLRLNRAGYQVIELPGLPLVHRLGTQKQVLGSRLSFVSHSPARNYYLIRISLVVARLHGRAFPRYVLTATTTILIEIAKILLVERQTGQRLRLVGRAFGDALRGRLGPLTDAGPPPRTATR